jgi:iron complex outermembrane recepter protein
MMLRSKRWRAVVGAGVAACLSAVSFPTVAQEGAIEEIVVTGTYIRRTTADSPSPLTVVSKADIDELGAFDVKDVVNSLTFNSGNISRSNAFSGGDNSTGETSINLRNLGVGSTMVLVNGKRVMSTSTDGGGNAYVNLTALLPNIALERVEVLKDGASALYGSDAIAGVANFITRSNFEGLEFQIDASTDSETRKQDDILASWILGMRGDRGHVMVAGSFLDRKPLWIGDRFDRYGQTGLSTFGQPGRYIPAGIPLDAVTGEPTAFGNNADLDCNLFVEPNGKGVQGVIGTNCVYDFSSFFALVGEEEQRNVFLEGTYGVTDSLEFYTQATFSDATFQRGNSLFPDVALATLPPDHPGLVNDASRRGIQPLPYIAQQRLLGGHDETPFSERPFDTRDFYRRATLRMLGGLRYDFQVGDRNWMADFSIGRTDYNSKFVLPSDTIADRTDAAYNGLGGPNCDGNRGSAFARLSGQPFAGNGECYFYNPFGSSRVLPDGSPQTDPALRNPDELIQWMAGEINTVVDSKQTVMDLVFVGDIGELNGYPIGLALGAQRIVDETSVDADQVANAFGYKFVLGGPDWDGKLTTTAAFAEVNVPLHHTFEANLALRYTDFDEIGQDSVDPKISLLWRPIDDLALRGSFGTSFRVGSLEQLFGSSTQLINITDGFAGGQLAFLPSITSGNPDLKPESADAWNFGFSWAPSSGPLEGFSIDADYYVYKYEDILSRESPTGLAVADFNARCPNGFNNDPLAGPLCGVQPGGGFVSIGAGNPEQVVRSAGGTIVAIFPSFFNASSLESSGIDLSMSYLMPTDQMGLFRFGLSGSWVLEYDLTLPDGTKVDGVGQRNITNSIGRSLPEFKANAQVGWALGRHSALVTARYIDSYEDEGPQNPLRALFIRERPHISSMTTVDVQYAFELPAFGFQNEGSTITVGAKNVFNREPPKVNVDGGYDPFAHDPRGRIWYARYVLNL